MNAKIPFKAISYMLVLFAIWFLFKEAVTIVDKSAFTNTIFILVLAWIFSRWSKEEAKYESIDRGW